MPASDAAVLIPHDGVMTIAGMRRALTETFRAADIDSPELDARVLVGHALSLDHAALRRGEWPPTRHQGAGNDSRVGAAPPGSRTCRAHCRQQGILEPETLVDSATLVPRPETETVVEAALAAIEADRPRTRPLRIADLGTGSGAILLALLAELPNAVGVGTDTNFGALGWHDTTPGASSLRRRRSWHATWPPRCAARSI